MSSHLRLLIRVGLVVPCGMASLAMLLWISSASAQYAPGTTAEDHYDGVRYFGSVKDESGASLADVAVQLAVDEASFVFITDSTGRFRGSLPRDIPADGVTATCWKAGLEPISVTTSSGPKSAEPAVEVDCVMRRTVAPIARQ